MSGNFFQSIVATHFKSNGGWLRVQRELAVYYWPRVAGKELAGRVEAIRCNEGFLMLQTENPALAHQVSMLSLEIVKRYYKLLGKGVVKGIRVKVGSIKSKPQPPVRNEIVLTPEEQSYIQECCKEIHDPDLSSKFGGLMKKAYQFRHFNLSIGGRKCSACGAIVRIGFTLCPSCEWKT